MATLPRLRPRHVLRPRGGGGAHPARSRSRAARCTPTSGAATARRTVTYLHPLLERSPGEDARRAAVPGAAHADGHRRRRLQPRRGRPAPPGHGLQAQPRAHGAAAPALRRRCRRAGRHRRRHRDHLGEAGRLRQLRLPREPLGELRLPRLRVVVAEALVPGGLLRRAARRPADGLLLAAHPRAGRPPPRRRGPHPRPQRLRRDGHPGASLRHWSTASVRWRRQFGGLGEGGAGRRRRRSGAGRGRRCGWGSPTCGGSGTTWPTEIAAGRPYADPEDLARRVPLTLPQLEALATSGAFDCFGMSRREAIWAAGAVAQMGTDRHGAQRLPGHRHRGRRRPSCRP